MWVTLASPQLLSEPLFAQTATERGTFRQGGVSISEEPGRAPRDPASEASNKSGGDLTSDYETTGDPPDADPENDLSRPKAGQRRAVQDGYVSTSAEPAAPVDGLIDQSEPDAPEDGDDPVAIDMRDESERAQFEMPLERPPAGYDPLLFQIEDIDPILDRRPERLFRIEPYDPKGIRLGSFVYFPETEIAAAAFNNVFSSPEPRSDVALEIETASRLVSNWNVHALELRTSSNWSFYDEFDTENEKEYLVEGRGRLDVTRRSNLQGLVSYEHTQESRSAIDASSVGDRPDVDTLMGSLSGTHRFNRLETQLRASISDEDFSNPSDGLGGTINNDDRDRNVAEEAARLTYELKPSLAVFAETELNQRRYEVAAFTDGIFRDSDGQRYRIGLDFGETGEVLRGEISLGYGLQNTKSHNLADVDSFLFDANLAWRVTDLTSLLLTGRTDIDDTTTANSGGVRSHEVGLKVRHAFRTYFLGTAGVTYTSYDYATVNIDENQIDYTGGLEYFANREFILFLNYVHSDFNSNEPDASWDSDEFRLGLRVRK
jgi:hypothetical protein